jgi:hypothetical protein
MFRTFVVVALAGAPVWASPTVAQQTRPSTLAIDSVRMLLDLSVLAHDSMEGRAAGTLGSLRARHFLQDALAETGALPAGGRYGHAFSWPGGTAKDRECSQTESGNRP